ncbi:MAG: hypothetical protein QXV17_03400 [Candidatus Micrarchaeaceae archaeon]
MFALGRDDVLPSSLSKVDGKGVPVNSINVSYVITIVIAVLMGGIFYAFYGFYNGLYYAWVIFGTLATLETLFVHILSNTSLTSISIREKSKNIIEWVVLPIATTIIMIIAYYYTLLGIIMPFLIAPMIFVVWIIISAVITYIYRTRTKPIDFQSMLKQGGE